MGIVIKNCSYTELVGSFDLHVISNMFQEFSEAENREEDYPLYNNKKFKKISQKHERNRQRLVAINKQTKKKHHKLSNFYQYLNNHLHSV